MADDQYNIGSALLLDIATAVKDEIIQYIRFIDASEPWDLPEEDWTMAQLRDYYTKPAYKTLANGKRVKARGPLAPSLEAGLRDTVRTGKVEWITILDRNTAKRDRELDGTIWDVTDPSGVTYTIQIATDDQFSEQSVVLERTGLTDSEYAIATEDKLKQTGQEAPYYWRVRAVDGAFNNSEWTTASAFYIGWSLAAMPGWTFYALAGLGALLLGVIGFWLARRAAPGSK